MTLRTDTTSEPPSPESPLEETEKRLLPAPFRGTVVAVSLSLVAVALFVAAYSLGGTSSGHHPAGHPAAHPGSLTPIQFLWRLYVGVAVIGGLASLGGVAARRIGQPSVAGQMVAGLLLGPSALGTLTPSLMHLVLPAPILPDLNLLAQAGLAIFMFTVGTEFDHRVLGRQSGVIGTASLAMMTVPFALGVAGAVPFYSAFAGKSAWIGPYVLFVGTALSVTAFPVLARIVQEAGLSGTRLGSLALVCAAVADVLTWCALAVVLAISHSAGAAGVLRTVALTVAFVVLLLAVVRPVLRFLAGRYAGAVLPTPLLLALVLGLICTLAAATDAISIHAIFGGFLAGVVLPRDAPVLNSVPERLGTLNRALLLPVFFASIGLQTNVRLAFGHRALLVGGAVLLVVAVVGKFGTAVVVGLGGGMPRKPALGLGVLMNARGVTEIVVLSTGLSIGIINGGAFTMLVLAALITTLMAVPALRLLGLFQPAVLSDPAEPVSTHQAVPAGGKESLT